MKTYKVRYELDETGWWVTSIPDVPGCLTQGRTIEQSRERIREALALMVGDKIAENAKLEDEVVLPKDAKRAFEEWLRAQVRAELARATADEATHAVATKLSKSMSLRDVGDLLGVSRQRAHQLLHQTKPPALAAAKVRKRVAAGRPEKTVFQVIKGGSKLRLFEATDGDSRKPVTKKAKLPTGSRRHA